MKKKLKDILGKKTLFTDGAMGSLLQGYGLKIGELPESFNVSHPDTVKKIHIDYLSAGSDIITLNTFGAYAFRYPNLEEIIKSAANAARDAISTVGKEKDAYIALDMGPTGKLLKPMGDLKFEESYEIFKQTAIPAQKHGAELVIIETMSDTYEIKSAVLAVKENTELPVLCSLTFDTHGRTMTGCDFRTMITLLEGLGVDAIGINCGFGPDVMKGYVSKVAELTSLPLLVQPNAGLPRIVDGKAVYDLSPVDFAGTMLEIHKSGASILGGCCGTTPEHIKEMVNLIKSADIKNTFMPHSQFNACERVACSYSKSVDIGEVQSSEPITACDIDDIVEEALSRIDDGDEIISIDLRNSASEEVLLPEAVQSIQEITNLPLCIISTNPEAIENALRIYNGKCALKITGCSDSAQKEIERSVDKYGAVMI